MSELVGLLTVQRNDNTLDQLRYKHEHLPERAIISDFDAELARLNACLLYTSPSPRDGLLSRMPSSA